MAKTPKKRNQFNEDNQTATEIENHQDDTTTTPIVSPLKKKRIIKNENVVAWYFILKDGNNITCKTKEEADFYVSEYENLITDTHTFTTEDEYCNFLHQHNSNDITENNKKTKTKIEKETAKKNARKLAADIIRNAKHNKPKNKLLIAYKAIPVSTKVIVVVAYFNMNAKHLFYAKPRNLHDYTKNYLTTAEYTEIKVERDEIVVGMINNMLGYRQRNPDDGPDSVVVTINKATNRKYEEEMTVTELDIPPYILTKEEEQRFLQDKLHLLGRTLLQIQATETFKEIMIEVLPERLTRWMYGRDAKYTFTEWCQTAEISVEPCNNLNKWITLEDANKLRLKMAQHRCPPRYNLDSIPSSMAKPVSPSLMDSPTKSNENNTTNDNQLP
jgi:hypothetical protein